MRTYQLRSYVIDYVVEKIIIYNDRFHRKSISLLPVNLQFLIDLIKSRIDNEWRVNKHRNCKFSYLIKIFQWKHP